MAALSGTCRPRTTRPRRAPLLLLPALAALVMSARTRTAVAQVPPDADAAGTPAAVCNGVRDPADCEAGDCGSVLTGAFVRETCPAKCGTCPELETAPAPAAAAGTTPSAAAKTFDYAGFRTFIAQYVADNGVSALLPLMAYASNPRFSAAISKAAADMTTLTDSDIDALLGIPEVQALADTFEATSPAGTAAGSTPAPASSVAATSGTTPPAAKTFDYAGFRNFIAQHVADNGVSALLPLMAYASDPRFSAAIGKAAADMTTLTDSDIDALLGIPEVQALSDTFEATSPAGTAAIPGTAAITGTFASTVSTATSTPSCTARGTTATTAAATTSTADVTGRAFTIRDESCVDNDSAMAALGLPVASCAHGKELWAAINDGADVCKDPLTSAYMLESCPCTCNTCGQDFCTYVARVHTHARAPNWLCARASACHAMPYPPASLAETSWCVGIPPAPTRRPVSVARPHAHPMCARQTGLFSAMALPAAAQARGDVLR